MLDKREFPILEFDGVSKAKIEPSAVIARIDGVERCVITFFGDVIEGMLRAGRLRKIAEFITATVCLPVYETFKDGVRVGVIQGFLGAAGAAAQLDELIAMGFSKFIVCGGAGVLKKDMQVGHLVVPSSAVRDEGASYHYLPPAREVACGAHAVRVIEDTLIREGVPYINAKTWTTDGFYRETEDKVALRKSEGCVTVEMEAAAFFAVAAFRGVTLGQILYCGDDLSGEQWDSRAWSARQSIRQNLTDTALSACLSL